MVAQCQLVVCGADLSTEEDSEAGDFTWNIVIWFLFLYRSTDSNVFCSCHLGCRFWPLCRSPQSTTKEIITKTSFEVENSYLKPQLFRKTDFTCYYSPSFLLHQWFVPMPFPRRLSLNCIPGAIQKLEGKLGLIFEN